MLKRILIVAVFLVLLCVAIVSAVYLGITSPIRSMLDFCKKLSDGDLSVRIQDTCSDELSDLSGSMNHMADTIERLIHQQKEQEEKKRELELQKEDTKRIIKSMMNHLAVQIFITIPKRYNGAKTFYTIINGTVVTLPIITSIEYTEDITLTIRMYNGISQYMDEFIFPLEPKKLFDGITFSTDNYQWYVGTNPVNIQKKFYENEHKHLSSEMELRRKEENFKLEKEKLKRENEILKSELDNSKATITQMNSALKTAKEVSSDSKETVLNYLKLGATIIVIVKTIWPIIKIVLDKK